MAIYGALAEAPSGNNASRKGEMVANGQIKILAGASGTATITLPIQMRLITNVLLTVQATASTGGLIATVGAVVNNTFVIDLWELDGTASDNDTTVNWLAFGKLA